MYVEASQPFEATFGSGTSGLVGTVEVAVEDNDGNVVIGPTSANISEIVISGVDTGVYSWNAPAAPGTLGQYTIVWSPDGTWDPETTSAPEDLVVVDQSVGPLPPIPPPAGGGIQVGPCTSWVTADEVAACCSVETSSGAMFDDVADQASQLLYELSGRQFSGLCSAESYRPPCDSCYCGWQVLSRGYVIGPWDYGYPLYLCDQCMISCAPSRVKLSGYPVREITEVKINGDVLDASEYTLWNHRYLTRLDDHRWPVAQDLTLPDTEDNTFSVSYTYGASPPLMGAQAAAQLGCELYKACAGDTCVLPEGTTRVIRQGIVIEKLAFTSWAFKDGSWRTGLPLVDAFLSAYNPSGIKRRPVFWAPGKRQYAQPSG